jgi:hypothetical protein
MKRSTRIYGVIPQKMVKFVTTAVRTSHAFNVVYHDPSIPEQMNPIRALITYSFIININSLKPSGY